MDTLPLNSIKRFQVEFYEYFDNTHPELLSEIKVKKAISDELKEKLKNAINMFTEDFKKTIK